MSPFRIRHPEKLAFSAVENGLIFFVLYLLADITSSVIAPKTTDERLVPVLAASVVFAGCLVGIRRSTIGDRGGARRELVLVVVISLIVGTLSFLGIWALFRSPLSLGPLLMLEGAIAVPAAVLVWRWISGRSGLFAWRHENIVIVGTGASAKKVCQWIFDRLDGDYRVVCFASEDPGRVGDVLCMGVRALVDYAGLDDYCMKHADRVIVALEEKRGRLPTQALLNLRLNGVVVEDATSFIERSSGKIAVENLLPSWLIFADGWKASPVRSAAKRSADFMMSVLLLALASPVMALTALLVKLDSRGPVLYRQDRVGKGGREFDLLKFRSMIADAERHTGPTWTAPDDPRITRVGRIIRKCRIDELPQLFNVLRGEMSFVGPRPERRHFVSQLERAIPYYALRLVARPGLTGWAQVEYGYGASVEDSREKLKYDLYYIKNASLVLDLWIVLKTVKVVLLGRGAR